MNQNSSRIPCLPKENTSCLRGLLAVAIIVAHWRNFAEFLNDTIPGMILTATGYLGVGLFFFLSGYGLRCQGPDYLRTFPRRRILPYYITYLIAVLLYALISKTVPTGVLLFRTLTWYGTIVDFGWYLQAQLLLYLLFWLVYRRSDSPWNPLLITGAFILLGVAAYGELWLEAILCFPLGIWWCDHAAALGRALRSHWGKFFFFAFLLFSVTLLLGNLPLLPYGIRLFIRMLSAPFFAAFVVTLLVKVPIQCRITRFLGEISGEMYVTQGFGFRLFLPLRETGHLWLYLSAILLTSIVCGWLLHQINARIYAYFKNT